MNKSIVLFSLAVLVTACAQIEPEPFEPSAGHIEPTEKPATESARPELVESVPVLPEPGEPKPQERYTVVVNEVPVKELLFALARDARINVDIHPAINGSVTINAVEQTLPQILKRISKQVDMRYEYDGDNLYISQDSPFLRTYKVDYVNLSRDTNSTSEVSTQITSTSTGDTATGSGGGGGGGGNTSTTSVTTASNHRFWQRLVTNVSGILDEDITAAGSAAGGEVQATQNVIPNPESGLLTVRATSKQHDQIQAYIDQAMASVKRQVLVQATIVEVELSERYQAGIDWSAVSTGAFEIISNTAAGVSPFASGVAASSFVIQTDDSDGNRDNIEATVTLLDEFGDTNVLSSPQMMVLNNQTAVLKVVENLVYFEVDAETTPGAVGAQAVTTVDTTARTVPVGIVMTVTPQIGDSGNITLNVRPTISRFVRNVADPNPELTNIENNVPQIAVREMESVLRLSNGQIGVLGGLMTDENRDSDAGLPGAKDAGFFGNLFKTTAKEYIKSELVILLKPTIINNPSIDSDLKQYREYLSRDYQDNLSAVQEDSAL
ncbi:MAG: pilus (MSHA type) biogenesis protein MshL [Gammaproteobacteria bacterium]